MATVQDLVTRSLKELGVLSEGDTPTAAAALDALEALNSLVDQWKAERLEIYSITRTTWTIVSGTGAYTLGTGGTINVARPVYVENVAYQDTSPTLTTEYPMSSLTDDAYQGLVLKTETSPFPQAWYLNPTYPLSTLTLWPTPTSSTLQGVLYAPAAVQNFAGLSTTVDLPPAYSRMLVKNLALELAPSYLYERPPNPLLMEQARDSKAAVKRSNQRLQDLQFPADALIGTSHGSWSIYTGS